MYVCAAVTLRQVARRAAAAHPNSLINKNEQSIFGFKIKPYCNNAYYRFLIFCIFIWTIRVQILMLCFSRKPRIHVFNFFANIRGGEPSARKL
jgi:hypothetical protein